MGYADPVPNMNVMSQDQRIPQVVLILGSTDRHLAAAVLASSDVPVSCPGLGVVSREFSDEFGGCLVVEASQSGAVVIGDEGEEVGIALGMVEKAAVRGSRLLPRR